ncbi:MAG: MATE family efflux transporter [Acidobacteriota bacterium]
MSSKNHDPIDAEPSAVETTQSGAEAADAAAPTDWWSTIKQALKGSGEQDFTSGHISRAVVLLAIPMVLEMSMESIFAVVDIFFVTRLGAAAITTVGLTESVLTVVYAVAVGLCFPLTAMVARRIGEKNREGAAVAAVQGIAVSTLIAVGLGILGAIYAPDILRLMGGDDEVVSQGASYTRIIMATNVVIFLLFLNNAIFRGAGDAAIALRALMLANAINIVLDPCLIFGLGPFPEMGITGAAVATSIGRGIGVAYQLWRLTDGTGRIVLRRRHLKMVPEVMVRLVRLSFGGIGQNLIATASWIALVRIIATFGTTAVAGYTIGVRVIIFALLPAWGLANAAATLVGQNLGAKKPDRAERSVYVAGWFNMAFLGSVTLIFLFAPQAVVGIFAPPPEVFSIAVACLRIIAFGYVFYAWEMVTIQAFNGAGDTLTPTWINFGCFWLLQIPLAWALAIPGGYGPSGVFAAIAISYSVSAVVGILLFRRGRWKMKEV